MMSYVDLSQWTGKDIADWMKGLEEPYCSYADRFTKLNHGNISLLAYDNTDYQILGINKIGHREMLKYKVQMVLRHLVGIKEETLHILAVRLQSSATALARVIKSNRYQSPPLNSRYRANRVPNEILSSVVECLSHSRHLINWLLRAPFADVTAHQDLAESIASSAYDLGVTVMSDSWADTYRENLFGIAENLAGICRRFITSCNDFFSLQPAFIQSFVIKMGPSKMLGLDFKIHSPDEPYTVSSFRENSPASRTLALGDQLLQVNFQTVVGWAPENLVAVIQNQSTVRLHIKKRPRNISSQVRRMSPIVISSNHKPKARSITDKESIRAKKSNSASNVESATEASKDKQTKEIPPIITSPPSPASPSSKSDDTKPRTPTADDNYLSKNPSFDEEGTISPSGSFSRKVSFRELGHSDISGTLHREVRSERWSQCFCVLKNDLLYVFASESATKADKVLHVQQLDVMTCQRQNRRYSFKLSTADNKEFYFSATNKHDLGRWVNSLSVAQDHKGRRDTGDDVYSETDDEEESPVTKPDSPDQDQLMQSHASMKINLSGLNAADQLLTLVQPSDPTVQLSLKKQSLERMLKAKEMEVSALDEMINGGMNSAEAYYQMRQKHFELFEEVTLGESWEMETEPDANAVV